MKHKSIIINYTNYRGETRNRSIYPKEIWYGKTKWHTGEQWFLKAIDQESGEERDFALFDIHCFGKES